MNRHPISGVRIITNLREVIENESSSSEDGSMSDLQDWAKEDALSSDGDTNLFGDDGIYDNGEQWGPNELSLKHIIGGKPGGMFPSNISTLYAFSWHGYAQVAGNLVGNEKSKADLYQAKE